MKMKEPKKELPPKYYLDNFTSLLSFVEGMYGPILKEEELAFISAFRELSEDGQCLFLRFVNRRGVFFRTDKLEYPEICQLPEALEELLAKEFVELPGLFHKPLSGAFLHIYSKPELLKLSKALSFTPKGLGKLKKPELIKWLLEDIDWEDLLKGAASVGPAIKYNYEQELEVLKFLFFGYFGGDMSEFVIRDLGMVFYESPTEDKLVPKFNSRKEVDDLFVVSLGYQHFRELREQNCPEILYSWYNEWESGQLSLSESAMPLWNRLTLKVAWFFERQQQYHWALEVYEKTEKPPSRERRVRLLHKTGEVQEALALCQQMQEFPQNADELFFARDYAEKIHQKKARKSTTLYLKEANEIQLSEEYRYQVEQGVIRYFSMQGKEGFHTENYLWRSLFGLVFWDIIFDHNAPVYHSPLQRSPSGLYLPGFFDEKKERMLERLKVLNKPDKLLKHVEKVHAEKWGIGNPLVGWHEDTLPTVKAACQKLTPHQLQQVLMEMARNLKENGRGFPDLFVWTKNDYLFVEVKSPKDTLSAQQLFWLQFFRECEINAKVLKVGWREEVRR